MKHPALVSDRRTDLPWRQMIAGAAVVLALSVSFFGALVGRGESGLALAIATASGGTTDALQAISDRMSVGYAFAVGMAAAVNPCGFALLPTYLGLFLGTSTRSGNSSRGSGVIGRALLVSASMTTSFVILFGAAGLILSIASAAAGTALPWISLAVGVALVVTGGFMLGGGSLSANGAERAAGQLGGAAVSTTVIGYAAYGLAFALNSLACTLPLFLAVVGSALTNGGALDAFFELVMYALGMGAVVAVLTVAVASGGQALVARVRKLGRFLEPLGAFLLLLTGAYVVYYWLSVGGLLG